MSMSGLNALFHAGEASVRALEAGLPIFLAEARRPGPRLFAAYVRPFNERSA